MRSDKMKTGVQRIAHRSLFKALGLTEEELATFHACCDGVRKNMEHLKDIE